MSDQKSIAVLPFDSLDNRPDDRYFVDGVQDNILTDLAKVSELKVISRSGVERYRGAPKDARAIGRNLGAELVAELTDLVAVLLDDLTDPLQALRREAVPGHGEKCGVVVLRLEPEGRPETIVGDLPDEGNHKAKALAFPGGDVMLVKIGSATNSCQQSNRAAKSPGRARRARAGHEPQPNPATTDSNALGRGRCFPDAEPSKFGQNRGDPER